MDILKYHQLIDYLKKACIVYYTNKPFISDIEYDLLYKKLNHFNNKKGEKHHEHQTPIVL